jgi:hypothetical protein
MLVKFNSQASTLYPPDIFAHYITRETKVDLRLSPSMWLHGVPSSEGPPQFLHCSTCIVSLGLRVGLGPKFIFVIGQEISQTGLTYDIMYSEFMQYVYKISFIFQSLCWISKNIGKITNDMLIFFSGQP